MGLRHFVVERAQRKLQYTKRLYSVSSDFSRFEWESLAITRVSEKYKREETHGLLRLANVVSPFLYTLRVCGE